MNHLNHAHMECMHKQIRISSMAGNKMLADNLQTHCGDCSSAVNDDQRLKSIQHTHTELTTASGGIEWGRFWLDQMHNTQELRALTCYGSINELA